MSHMSAGETRSAHLSLRVKPSLHAQLTHEARSQPDGSRSRLAERLIDEGLRMEMHPGIVFRSGPAGRRPRLIGGPDVWEVARVYRDLDASELPDEDRVTTTASLSGQPLHHVRAAVAYYRTYTSEIDGWIEMVDREADVATSSG